MSSLSPLIAFNSCIFLLIPMKVSNFEYSWNFATLITREIQSNGWLGGHLGFWTVSVTIIYLSTFLLQQLSLASATCGSQRPRREANIYIHQHLLLFTCQSKSTGRKYAVRSKRLHWYPHRETITVKPVKPLGHLN